MAEVIDAGAPAGAGMTDGIHAVRADMIVGIHAVHDGMTAGTHAAGDKDALELPSIRPSCCKVRRPLRAPCLTSRMAFACLRPPTYSLRRLSAVVVDRTVSGALSR